MSRYKVLNGGRTVDGLPTRAVLEDEALPGEISSALEAWREAVGVLVEAAGALRAAEREARGRASVPAALTATRRSEPRR